MKKNDHIVKKVTEGSPLFKKGVLAGDRLVLVNGQEIEDVFDYRYLILAGKLEFTFERNNEQYRVEIEKEEDEDPGIEFEEGLMDSYRRCRNNCIFCFIDQMPKGMRETLYFKDDDSRLSFLQGNYVTLTNLSEKDVDRIIKYRMEPLNISFQTTNPQLRCKMLNNRFAGESLKIADKLFEAGIKMNGQIVLCKGVNDGEELVRSIEDLMKYAPVLESVSIVPVGITKYREGLFPLESFDREDAKKVISLIEKYQAECVDKFGLHFVHASDEWYILAGREVPSEESYDGYLQLENGVGMLRLLDEEFREAFESLKPGPMKRLFMRKFECTSVTGQLAFPYIKKYADMIMNEFPKVSISVVPIRNDFFGEKITVAGLVTGGDIIKQLKERKHAKNLLIPECMLKADEQIFLDDVTLRELEDALQVKAQVVKSSGYDLFMSMIGAN